MVAAVSGYAVGAGLELALMCDLRVVEENAVMGCLNRRFGKYLVAYFLVIYVRRQCVIVRTSETWLINNWLKSKNK